MSDDIARDFLPSLSEKDLEVFHKWYFVDLNHSPNGQYVLRNLVSLNDDSYWKDALPTLLRALSGLPFSDRKDLHIGQSVTEYELRCAVNPTDHSEEDNSRLVWLYRRYADGVTKTGSWWEYDDTLEDAGKAMKRSNLYDWMNNNFNTIHHFSSATYEDHLTHNVSWQSQFERWSECVREICNNEIEKAIATKIMWNHNGCELGIPGNFASEILHHLEWARMKCRMFFGRKALLSTAMRSILHPAYLGESEPTHPEKNQSPFAAISLYLVGGSGAGKTALMAKLADELFRYQLASGEDELVNRPVIIRFCGTSGGCMTGLDLIQSISLQIQLIYQLPLILPSNTISYQSSVETFHSLLKAYPVALFIDSLDQLSNADLARSNLTFLTNIEPHRLTRIVLSTLPDEVNAQGSGWRYFYGCESQLRRSQAPRLAVMMDQDDADIILTSLLAESHRKLTASQRNVVQASFAVEPCALYLTLAMRVVKDWCAGSTEKHVDSSDSKDSIPAGVQNLIEMIFDQLERNFGVELTRAATAFITFAVKGVSDAEMVDLLSLHDGVMKSVNQYNTSDNLPMRKCSDFQYQSY